MKYEVDTLHIDGYEQEFIIAIFHGLAQTLPAWATGEWMNIASNPLTNFGNHIMWNVAIN